MDKEIMLKCNKCQTDMSLNIHKFNNETEILVECTNDECADKIKCTLCTGMCTDLKEFHDIDAVQTMLTFMVSRYRGGE